MSKQLVVVGNGMAGVACVEQILKYRHDFEITIFGDETHVNYNRILLSSVLAGEKSSEDIVLNDIDWYRHNSGGKGVGFFQIGGGIAGSAIEEGVTQQNGVEIVVRLDNGQMVSIVQAVGGQVFSLGQRVQVITAPDGTSRVTAG